MLFWYNRIAARIISLNMDYIVNVGTLRTNKIELEIFVFVAISFLVCSICPVNLTVYAQSFLQTIKYRNLVLDLGNGLTTSAQLTMPSIDGKANGKYPAVLLITGSGAEDMNETEGFIRIDNNTGQKIYPPTPFFQIAQYLSERGFVVLRYDKRGISTNHTILDSNVWGNLTVNDLVKDANKVFSCINEPA